MKQTELWAKARNTLLNKLKCSVADEILFVDDRLVKYDPAGSIRVKRADLFRLDDDTRWATYIDPRPTWLHFNLLTIADAFSVVTLRRSETSLPVDDVATTPVNVSTEPKTARVE